MKALSGLIVLLFLAQFGCSTASVRVMPGENGVHRVISKDIKKESAEEEAIDAANKYCKERKQEAVFIQDKTQYTGSMDESTRNTIRKASTAAQILGGTGSVHDDTRTAGAILGSAGTVGHVMTNDRDYTSEVQFKCK